MWFTSLTHGTNTGPKIALVLAILASDRWICAKIVYSLIGCTAWRQQQKIWEAFSSYFPYPHHAGVWIICVMLSLPFYIHNPTRPYYLIIWSMIKNLRCVRYSLSGVLQKSVNFVLLGLRNTSKGVRLWCYSYSRISNTAILLEIQMGRVDAPRPNWFATKQNAFRGANSPRLLKKGRKPRWVVLISNEEAFFSKATNKKGHYIRATGSSNLLKHASTGLPAPYQQDKRPSSPPHYRIICLASFLLLFNGLLPGFTPRPYCRIIRARACTKSLFFSPYLFFCLLLCCALGPCTLRLLTQSAATSTEGPAWLGTVRPAPPSGSHCVV